MSIDSYHFESIEGVDAVLDRLCRIVGAPPETPWADALDLSRNTVKTWRQRGAVPLRYLQGFALDHGVTLEYLQRGEESVREPRASYGMNADEERLLKAWRSASAELRAAAMRVLDAPVNGSR